jgi:hypothetical protein
MVVRFLHEEEQEDEETSTEYSRQEEDPFESYALCDPAWIGKKRLDNFVKDRYGALLTTSDWRCVV